MPFLGLAVWYVVFGTFAFWWEPENPEFWVTTMVPFWALWAGGLWLAGRPWRRLLVGLVVVIFACNLGDVLRRKDTSSDPQVAAVLTFQDRVGPDGVILLPPVLDAKAGFFAPGLDRIGVYPICKEHPEDGRGALEALLSQVDAELAGRPVFFYARAFSREVLAPHPWCREVEASFREHYRLVPRFEVELPVDDDESDGSRSVARWQAVPVLQVLPRR